MFFETIVQIVFGWPAIILTILLSIAGLISTKPTLLIITGFICMPFTYYASNGFQNPYVILPLLQFASAFAIKRQKQVIAWALIMPLVFVSATLAYAVLTQ